MKKRYGFIIAVACLMVLMLALPVLAEDEPAVTITGDGVAKEVTFTMTEMKEMKDGIVSDAYSTTNNYPTDKVIYAEGISLEYLLARSGIKNDATLIKVISDDGYYKTFTREQLLGENLFSYAVDKKGKKVPAILNLRAGEEGFDSMKPASLTLTMGQRAPAEQTNPWFAKNVRRIEVTTAAPVQWEPVTFSRSATPNGVEVILKHSAGDNIKIYYTTDGTVPTVFSKIYNISAARFQPELNVPIMVSADTVIKAVAIGPGKLDSEVMVCNISFSGAAFMDLAGYDWAKTSIEALAEKEILNGKSAGLFAPADSLKRSEFAKMMVLALGQQPTSEQSRFSDVAGGAWYAGYVNKATQLGLLEGFPDGTFKPDKILSKQEMVTIVIRAMGKGSEAQALTPESETMKVFAGESRISGWARGYVALAEAMGLLEHGHMVTSENGQNQKVFYGEAAAIRAEAAYIVDKMMAGIEMK